MYIVCKYLTIQLNQPNQRNYNCLIQIKLTKLAKATSTVLPTFEENMFLKTQPTLE
jgi:hypothetical protein